MRGAIILVMGGPGSEFRSEGGEISEAGISTLDAEREQRSSDEAESTVSLSPGKEDGLGGGRSYDDVEMRKVGPEDGLLIYLQVRRAAWEAFLV
jgi:hypothetical protein